MRSIALRDPILYRVREYREELVVVRVCETGRAGIAVVDVVADERRPAEYRVEVAGATGTLPPADALRIVGCTGATAFIAALVGTGFVTARACDGNMLGAIVGLVPREV